MLKAISARSAGLWFGQRLGLAAALLLVAAAAPGLAAPAVGAAPVAGVAPSAPVRTMLEWIARTGDARGQPYAIIDKTQAHVFVFAADGKPLADTVALLGAGPGDPSAPGIGDRPLSAITPAERTTPAGRFEAALDTNVAGHRILWVDYDDAISLHAVVTGNAKERRLQRLASPTLADNRISYGCINVPAAFFAATILTVFRTGGIVYILPEQLALGAVFPLSAGPSATASAGRAASDAD